MKFNRIVATGLLALLIANFSACDEVSPIGVETDTNGNPMFETTTNDSTDNKNPSKWSGSIWDVIKQKDAIKVNKFPYREDQLEGYAIPVTFLQEEGLLTRDNLGYLQIVDGENASSSHQPLKCYAFINEATPENDVYLILQYQNQHLIENQDNPDVYLATWQLKYTLDDDDYKTFLNMQNDWRIRLFIREMDRQYKPEVISKSIINYDLLVVGSYVEKKDRKFPNVFVTDIDTRNQIITFAGITNEGVRYYKIDMRKTNAWDVVVSRDGLTEEERENAIQVATKSTILGECLTEFHVNYIKAGYTRDQSKEAFNNTTDISYLTPVDINVRNNNYNFSEMIK